MENFRFIGIDISKKKLDWNVEALLQKAADKQTENTKDDIIRYMRSLLGKISPGDQVAICAEYTGRYIYPLVQACKQEGYTLWLVSGAEIKLSLGVQRGKSDKIDAKRIAEYAKRFCDKMRVYKPANEEIDRIDALENEREMLVTDRAKYTAQIGDMEGFMEQKTYKDRKKRLSALITLLDKSIQEIEAQIRQSIKKDSHLERQYEIITSIKGVGPQTAIAMLVATKGFSKFDDCRAFNCHAGIAPFAYNSGSSLKGKARVSHRADKKIKSLLHMAALSAIKAEGEMREYYLRKTLEGKNPMLVINAVRGKLVSRMFALVRDDRTFEQKYENSYAA